MPTNDTEANKDCKAIGKRHDSCVPMVASPWVKANFIVLLVTNNSTTEGKTYVEPVRQCDSSDYV